MEAGADALGFNGFRGSKRFLDFNEARAWIEELPPFVCRVAVLVNPEWEEIERGRGVFDWVQLHGDESPGFCRNLAARGIRFIKALRVDSEKALENLDRFGTRFFLLDAFRAGEFGGTGETFDWGLALKFKEFYPDFALILSGGLIPDNVGEAVKHVRPWAVDVASGVESGPGRKDVEKMRRFTVRATEA